MTPRPLMPLEEALTHLRQAIQPLPPESHSESLPTLDALGRVLAAAVISPIDVPPADNTSMDGYALRAADVTDPGVVLPVSQRIPAGHPGQPLARGTAARIFTGGLLPPGADAVVMQEQCEARHSASDSPSGVVAHDSELGHVAVLAEVSSGQWVRRRGEDIVAGRAVLARGARLTPQALGLAASVGCARLQVMRRLRVAVLSTGDELAMPGEVAPQELKPGAIYNSNRYTLKGLLQAMGCEVTDLGIVTDTLQATRAALRKAAGAHDVIVTTGGVSVGEEDHIRPAVRAEGELALWQIAMKPGKPLAFGQVRRALGPAGGAARPDCALFFGLPGNPVSAFVTFCLMVRPALLCLLGAVDVAPPRLRVQAGFDWPSPDRRREFLRVRVGADGRLELFANQSSGVLTSAVWADGLVDNPSMQVIRAGDQVDYLPLAGLIHP